MVREILIGVLGVVAGSVATVLIKWPGQWWQAFWTWYHPDHSSLYGSSWALTTTTSSNECLRVQAVCAPDRSLGRSELNPDCGIRLIHDFYPGDFPEDPAFSMPGHGVRFEHGGEGVGGGYAWVWVNGRLDYDCYVTPRVEEGRVYLPLLEVLAAIAKVARASASPEYRQVFGGSRLRARRFDWFIGVSPSIVTPDGITMSWTDIDFPGQRPRRAGKDPQAFCPAGGYGKQGLTSWNPGRPVVELLREFLGDFLHQNGYYDCEAAITNTLAAFSGTDAVMP